MSMAHVAFLQGYMAKEAEGPYFDESYGMEGAVSPSQVPDIVSSAASGLPLVSPVVQALHPLAKAVPMLSRRRPAPSDIYKYLRSVGSSGASPLAAPRLLAEGARAVALTGAEGERRRQSDKRSRMMSMLGTVDPESIQKKFPALGTKSRYYATGR